MRYHKVRPLLLVLFLSSLLMAPQAVTRIQGKVIDPEGAPIPGAVVTLSGSAMSPRSTVTSAEGVFRFFSVPPGEYSIQIEIAGFETKAIHNIIVTIGQAVEINISMDETFMQKSWELPPPPQKRESVLLQTSQELDALVGQLSLGQILYNPPSEMIEYVTERVEVRVSQSLVEDLTSGLRGQGIPNVEKVLVGSSMKATLLGEDFKITSFSESIQKVFSAGFTQWEWDATPTKAGEKTLYLSLAAIFDTQFGEKAKSYPVLDRKIHVKVNHIPHPPDWEKILKYIATIVGIIGGVIGIIKGVKLYKKKKGQTGADINP